MKIKKPYNLEGAEKTVLTANVADALSHPLRIDLINYVKKMNKSKTEVCNKDLVEHFPYSQSSLSQHIKKLRDVGIFTVEFSEKRSYYSVDKEVIQAFCVQLLKW